MHHLETCLLIAEADRALRRLVMFLTVFFHYMYKINEIQLLSRFFCYSLLVCLLGFWLISRMILLSSPQLDA